MKSELIVDSFAGGGGASLGIAWALGRAPDIAVNHSEAALAMHEANHPSTKHVLEDVWKARLADLTRGRKVGLLWASPDCTHHSRAKGATPVKKEIRSLAWVVIRWAKEIKPRVIILENVREFEEWGPLVPRYACRQCDWKGTEGQARLARVNIRCPRCNAPRLKQTDEMFPDPKRKGLTFKRWVGLLRAQGYRVEWKVLNAADFGAPTHRRRLFLVARRDGLPVAWPEPTHGDPRKLDQTPLFDRLQPWRTAAECIDWDVPCPSVFDRKKPLKEATMRRIAMGIKRYVLEADQPFIVPMTHSGDRRSFGIDEPLPTITTAKRGELGLVKPVMAPLVVQTSHTGSTGRGHYAWGADQALRTVSQSNEFSLVTPVLIEAAHGSDGRWADGTKDIHKPIGTIHAGGNNFALVSAFIVKHFGGMVGVSAETPLPTTTGKGCQNQIVTANLVHMNHGEKQWSAVDEPLRTITSSNHAALIYSFLIRYFGTAIGQHVTEPLYTITGKDRFGLVVAHVAGKPYVIVDIGMRMLTPRELARAQGFPDTYMLTGTKTSQVARIGNSVCPHVAKALAEANLVIETTCTSQ